MKTIDIILKNNKLFFIGLVFSILFLVINIITLNWYPLPWVDEVGTADTPINVVLTGKWFSTVWHYSYNLLHAFLLIPWIRVFGVSHAAVTSLNIIIAFFLFLLLLHSLISSKIVRSIWALFIFLLMFWGANVLSWNFRSGRIDVLIMLFTFLVVVEILKFASFHKKNYIRLYLFSFLLFLAGVPSIPFVFFLLLILFISQSQYRSVILKQTMIFVIACLIGFSLVSLFYWFHNNLLHYWGYFISFNATIVGNESILTRITEAYKLNKEALILSLVNIFVILLFFFRKIVTLNSINLIFLFSCLFVPLIMTLAGRYALYYSWLFFIPTLVITTCLFDKSPLYIKVFISLITFFVFITGFPNSLLKADKFNIARINRFITSQPINSNSIVVADHTPYYAIKNITNRCYFPGAASSEIMADKPDSMINTSSKNYGKLNFLYERLRKQLLLERENIIVDKIDFIIKSPESYGSESLNIFLTKQKYFGKAITAIDSMNNPKIIIYQVK